MGSFFFSIACVSFLEGLTVFAEKIYTWCFLDMEEGSEYLKLSFQRKELKDLNLGSIPTTQHTVLFWCDKLSKPPSLFAKGT